MELVWTGYLLLSSLTWLVVSQADYRTVEVKPGGDVNLSCTNVSTTETMAMWMRAGHTSLPVIISSVYGTYDRTLKYRDGFQQGNFVMEYNLFFLNLKIHQVNISDSGWYFCIFYHGSELVVVNSTFVKIHVQSEEDGPNSESDGTWIRAGVILSAVIALIGLVLWGHFKKQNPTQSNAYRAK